jgi:hypothetical protein
MSASRSVIVKQDAKERPKHTVRWIAIDTWKVV